MVYSSCILRDLLIHQALEYFEKSQKPSSSHDDTTDSELDQGKLSGLFLNNVLTDKEHPKFEVTVKRKFEIAEMCEIFVSKYLKYAYLVLVSVFGFLACWSFSTVAASAWSINIPYRIGAAEQCSEEAFFHNVLPSGGCLYAYYLSLTLFGVIVVTLSLFDLKEQAIVQLAMGVLRFTAVAAIVIYCVVRLVQDGDACLDIMEASNFSTPLVINVGMKATVLHFDIKGWVVAVPIFVFAFLFHTGISSLTHPIKQKSHLSWLLVAMFTVSTVCYLSLGVVVPLWFRASIQETCTLNWVSAWGDTHFRNFLFVFVWGKLKG